MSKIRLEANKWYKAECWFSPDRNCEFDESELLIAFKAVCGDADMRVLIDDAHLTLGKDASDD